MTTTTTMNAPTTATGVSQAAERLTLVRDAIASTPRQRSAWMRAVYVIALDMIDAVEEVPAYGVDSAENLRRTLLRGAPDWAAYTFGGMLFRWDGEIARLLMSPARYRYYWVDDHALPGGMTWYDLYARAVEQAWHVICDTWYRIEK